MLRQHHQSATLPSRQWAAPHIAHGEHEHQYSTTVIQRPQPTRRRVRSILWQHPLKRKGGQFNLHETAQEQRRNQQGAEVSRQGDRAHQEESQPIREEHEQKAVQYIEMQVPITDLNPLSNLNKYRRTLGLGPSKNLMSSAVYNEDPSVIYAYYNKNNAEALVPLSKDEEESLRQVQEKFQTKCERRLVLGGALCSRFKPEGRGHGRNGSSSSLESIWKAPGS